MSQFQQIPPYFVESKVGMTGFEPVTFCTQNKRATKLRYIPFSSIGYNSLIVKNPCLVFHILTYLYYYYINYLP